MKRTVCRAVTVYLLSCFLGVTGFASGPGMISYQGLLTDSSGDPVSGSVTVTFTIYDDSTGTTVLWQETHADISVSGGQFSVILGQGTPSVPIEDSVFAASERWLGIAVGGDPEIVPRTRLVSVPYSHRVSTVEGAEAGEIAGILEIGPSSRDFGRYESGIIVTGSDDDSVIISPADDIVLKGTADDGVSVISMTTVTNFDMSSGVVEITSSDAAKAGTRKVLINPGDSIVLQGVDGNGDIAINLGMNEYGGNLHITSSDAAKFDPDATTSTVFISPSDNVALQAEDLSGDTLINLSTSGSEGRITLKSNAGDGLSRVEIGDDGIYFFDDTRSDTTMVIHADGSVTGKGQLAMGQQHADLSDWSNVLGYDNDASGDSAVVSGGYDNVASGYTSTVSGGKHNSATGISSTVSGGSGNSATQTGSVVSGGSANQATRPGSVVGGGTQNYAEGNNATIAGGMQDSVLASWSAVLGGVKNTCAAQYSCVVAGYENRINYYEFPHYSFLGGGYSNTIGGEGCIYSAPVGGIWNTIDDANACVLVGGEKNYCGLSGYSFVGGGENDSCFGGHSVICGGGENYIEAGQNRGVIIGGRENRIIKIPGSYSSGFNFIGNGYRNVTAAEYSVILDGYENYNEGDHSVILGGQYDTLGSDCNYSAAFGNHVYLNSTYTLALFGNGSTGKLGVNRDDNSGGVSYPIHVGTSTSNGNGAYLTAGGTWTNGSSREFKDRFTNFDGDDLLARIQELPVRSWYYKGTSEKHIGPVSEDFVAAFDVGVTTDDGTRDDKYLSTGDVAGVALAAVKELMKLDEKSEEIESLKSRIAELEKATK